MEHTCPYCRGTFKGKRNLNRHLLTHSGINRHSCSKCCKQFALKGTLDVHMRSVHLKIKPYKCTVCSLAFSQRTVLRNHLGTHDKEKRYPCALCQAAFVQKVDLLRHIDSAMHAGKIYWVKSKIMRQMCYKMAQKSYIPDTFQHHFF